MALAEVKWNAFQKQKIIQYLLIHFLKQNTSGFKSVTIENKFCKLTLSLKWEITDFCAITESPKFFFFAYISLVSYIIYSY